MELRRDISPSYPVSRDLLSQKVTDLLRHQIVSGMIPDGTRLVEEDLARRFGVSRGPVREALDFLEREGLVRSLAGKGAYARAITADSVRHLFAVRVMLEKYAAELAAEHVAAQPESATELCRLADEFVNAAKEGSSDDYVKLDHSIHYKIWELSGNGYLADVLHQLARTSATILSLRIVNRTEYRTRGPESHRKLAKAIAAGDPEAARNQVQAQFADSLEEALLALELVGGKPIPV